MADIQKIKGTIGPEVLQAHSQTLFANHKVLRAFRDYLEDRLENAYGVMATISIVEDGLIEYGLVIKDSVISDKELAAFTEKCLEEFRNNPINEVYR